MPAAWSSAYFFCNLGSFLTYLEESKGICSVEADDYGPSSNGTAETVAPNVTASQMLLSADEDHGRRGARDFGSVQYVVEMPSPQACPAAGESASGSTQAACSRQPVPSMSEDPCLPICIQPASPACHSRSSHRDKGRDIHLPGGGGHATSS